MSCLDGGTAGASTGSNTGAIVATVCVLVVLSGLFVGAVLLRMRKRRLLDSAATAAHVHYKKSPQERGSAVKNR